MLARPNWKAHYLWLGLLMVSLPASAIAQEQQGTVRLAASPAVEALDFSNFEAAGLQPPETVEPQTGAVSEPQSREDSLAPLQSRDLSPRVAIVNLSIAEIGTGVVPASASEQRAAPAVMLPDGFARGAVFKQVLWRPSCICHFPLYFEDAMLERHGHVRFGHLQPWASGVKFFGTIPLLPYLKTLQPGCECEYALGHYRAGSCAPPLKDHLPWDRRAAVVETLSAASFFWAAPL